jgi:hypothetical protein
MHTAEWGEQPTRRFFKVAQVATQSAGIRRLYKYVPRPTPGTGSESKEIVTDLVAIATSLAAFWQDVYVNRDPPGGLSHLSHVCLSHVCRDRCHTRQTC